MPIDLANAAVAPLEASTQIGGSMTPSGTTRTDANARGRRRDVLDQNLWCRARNAGHAVVFGEPVAHEPQALRQPGQVNRLLHRFACRGSAANGNEVEDGKCKGVGSHLMRTLRRQN